MEWTKMSDSEQSQSPEAEDLFECTPIVGTHRFAGLPELLHANRMQNVDELLDRLEVRQVWKVVEVGQRQPVFDRGFREVVVRVRHVRH